jgi:hypothetical protein
MRFAVFFLLAFQTLPAAVTSSEKALRERADKFYTLLVARQYRQSEPFVSAGDRDTYYAMEKPLLLDYKIKKITFDSHSQTATLDMESTTKVRRPMIGEMTIPLSYLSHWKRVNGVWFWYIPSTETRDTPFGKMVFSKKGVGQENAETIQKRIAEAPSPAAVLTAVKVSTNIVALGTKAGDTAIVSLKNTLPGRVKLVMEKPKNALFTFDLFPLELGEGDRATLIVKRLGPGVISPTQINLTVQPTQQQIVFQVR